MKLTPRQFLTRVSYKCKVSKLFTDHQYISLHEDDEKTAIDLLVADNNDDENNAAGSGPISQNSTASANDTSCRICMENPRAAIAVFGIFFCLIFFYCVKCDRSDLWGTRFEDGIVSFSDSGRFCGGRHFGWCVRTHTTTEDFHEVCGQLPDAGSAHTREGN